MPQIDKAATVLNRATSPKGGSSVEAPVIDPQKQPSPFQKAVTKLDNNKQWINFVANGLGALANLYTFLAGNFNFSRFDNEHLEKVSNFFAKIATGAQGLVGATDCLKKENYIPAVGFAAEIPIAVLSSGYNLWLSRGLSQGLGQFQAIVKRRFPKIQDKSGQVLEFEDNYQKVGGWEGCKITLKESLRIVQEILRNPKDKSFKFSKSLFTSSVFQILGSLIAFSGLHLLGAGVRDAAGAAVDIALMLDNKEKEINPNLPYTLSSNFKPGEITNGDKKISYVPCGIVWISSAIVDFFKRFDFFSSKVNNSTQLSLFFDRAAAILYGIANFGKKKQGESQPSSS